LLKEQKPDGSFVFNPDDIEKDTLRLQLHLLNQWVYKVKPHWILLSGLAMRFVGYWQEKPKTCGFLDASKKSI